MDQWQIARQLRSLARAHSYSEGDADAVFGTVLVSAGVQESALRAARLPLLLIKPSTALPEADAPSLEDVTFELTLLCANRGDAYGQATLLGGARAGAPGTHGGQGLLELERELKRVVGYLASANGVRLFLRMSSEVAATVDATHGYVISRTFVFSGKATAQPTYEGPYNLVAVDNGDETTGLTWSLPPDRFDTLGLVLRRAAGSTPPASATSGTDVPVAAGATSLTDAAGAGTWSYALFRSFDELTGNSLTNDAPTTAGRYSSAATATVTVLESPLTTLGAALLAWWNPDDPDTITEDTGVSVLADLSGNGYDLSQATGSKQPTLVASAINDRSALLFDRDGAQKLFGAIGAITREVVVWAVFQPGTDLQTFSSYLAALADASYASNGKVMSIQTVPGVNVRAIEVGDAGMTSGSAQAGGTLAVGTVYVVRARFITTTSRKVAVDDGAEVEDTTDLSSLTIGDIDRFCLGGLIDAFVETGATDGYVGEVLVALAPTSDQINSIDSYLSTRWQA